MSIPFPFQFRMPISFYLVISWHASILEVIENFVHLHIQALYLVLGAMHSSFCNKKKETTSWKQLLKVKVVKFNPMIACIHLLWLRSVLLICAITLRFSRPANLKYIVLFMVSQGRQVHSIQTYEIFWCIQGQVSV